MRTTEPPGISHAPPLPHQPALDHARKVGAWVVRVLEIPPSARRSTAAMALHDQVIEHHVAIVTLAERQVFGAMLSLLRPMVDRHVSALWIERLTGDAIVRFLTGPDTPDIESLLRLMRKTARLGDADALLAAWEGSALYSHPALTRSADGDGGRIDSTPQYVPTLENVVDTLNFSTGLALLSTMRMAQLVGDGGAEQGARFRLGVMAGIGR